LLSELIKKTWIRKKLHKTKKETLMKKIIFACLMIMSTQGYCFPHLEDYNVKTEISLQENKKQKIRSFDRDLDGYLFKMYLFVSDNFYGRCNTCPITGYEVWIVGTGKDTKVSIRKKGGEKEHQQFLQIIKDGFLSYFDGGYLCIIKDSDDEEAYYCCWVEYTK